MVSNSKETAAVKRKPISGQRLGSSCNELDMKAFQRLLSGYEKARAEGFTPINPALEELLSASEGEKAFTDQSIYMPGLTDNNDDASSQEIISEPFYFVKLYDREGQKTFINMCGSSEIAAPGEWQSGVPLELEESFSLMESDADNGTQNLRFSLSCSDYILSTDKQGNLCKVYDVVFNQMVMRHSMVHKQLRTFLINMAITWINEKYGVNLKSDYKIPRGKYKGETVRKHHIRAPKAQLVTELPDADADANLQPSFPLLTVKPSQTLGLQAEDSTNSKKVDKSSALFESVLGMCKSPQNSTQSGLLEEAKMSSQHEEIAESLPDFFQKEHHNGREVKPEDAEVDCKIHTDEKVVNSNKFLRKDNKMHKENVFCGSSSSIFCDPNSGPCEPGDVVLSQALGMQSAQLYFKRTPLIQTKFLGCPMELVVLCITFPSSVSNNLIIHQ